MRFVTESQYADGEQRPDGIGRLISTGEFAEGLEGVLDADMFDSASDTANGKRFAELSLSLASLLEDDSMRNHLQGKMLQVGDLGWSVRVRLTSGS